MRQEKEALKERVSGLYGLALRRIEECKSRKEIIPFPEVFGSLCRGFSIKKVFAWEILFILRDLEFIEIVAFKGVKLKWRGTDIGLSRETPLLAGIAIKIARVCIAVVYT